MYVVGSDPTQHGIRAPGWCAPAGGASGSARAHQPSYEQCLLAGGVPRHIVCDGGGACKRSELDSWSGGIADRRCQPAVGPAADTRYAVIVFARI